jgi:hypothetical protein
MADGQIELQLTLETGEVVKAFTKVETQAVDSAKKVEGTFSTSLKDGVSSGFKTLGKLAAGGFVAAFAAGIGSIALSLKEGLAAEASLTKFNASLRAAGMFSQGTTQSFQTFAAELQKSTKFTDDQVLALSSLSLNYAKNEEQAKKLTKAAIELSAATGQSAEDALRQLGGTLEGSAGKLAKLGGGFSDLTKAQLESGAAIDLVLQRFKGLAGAETQTIGGILGQITKAWNDLSEATGLAILNSPKLKAALQSVLQSLRSLGDGFNAAGFTKTVDSFVSGFANVANTVSGIVVPVFELLLNIFVEVGRQLGNLAGAAVELFAGNFRGAIETLGNDIGGMFDRITQFPIADKITTFTGDLVIAVDSAKPIVNQKGSELGQEFSNGLSNGIKEAGFGIVGLFDQIFGMIGDKSIATTVTINELAKNIQGSFLGGITSSFSALGAALAKGENGLAAFGKAVLQALGGVAIQIGTILVAAGLGWSLIPGFQASAGAVPLGLGLIALGGALQALGGGGSKGPATSAGGGVGATGAASESVSAEEATAGIQEPGTQLVVNVQGSVFDSDETGLRIADIIKTNFDRKDVRFA